MNLNIRTYLNRFDFHREDVKRHGKSVKSTNRRSILAVCQIRSHYSTCCRRWDGNHSGVICMICRDSLEIGRNMLKSKVDITYDLSKHLGYVSHVSDVEKSFLNAEPWSWNSTKIHWLQSLWKHKHNWASKHHGDLVLPLNHKNII